MLKKILLKGLNILSILMIICSLGVLLTVVMTKKGDAPNVLGYSLFRVMTGSMEPNIPTNALIVVKRVEPQKLELGEVISFYSRDPSLMGEVNTHRIVGIEEVGGRYVFTTKGDANNVEDRYVTYGEDVIGKVIFSSYRLGQTVRLISNPIIFVPLIIIPLVIMLGHSVWESITLAAKLAKEEEEAAVREALAAIRQKREAQNVATGGEHMDSGEDDEQAVVEDEEQADSEEQAGGEEQIDSEEQADSVVQIEDI
ncbi:MAG: signal peptidase I [Lachnospiraceae bacterium]|nr:signal peptidase I [Lachnospiraceae bacterium]